MAISLNGVIATSENKEDFLSNDNWNEFVNAVEQTKCLIWGRKTYELVRNWDKKYLDSLSGFTKVIISRDPNLRLDDGFTLAASPEEAIKILSEKGFTEAILTGGSKNNTSFAKLGLIDEIIVDVEGVVVGKGIPLFDPEDFVIKLEFIDSKKISPNIVQLHYRVIKS